jgi:hypothetical protein
MSEELMIVIKTHEWKVTKNKKNIQLYIDTENAIKFNQTFFFLLDTAFRV